MTVLSFKILATILIQFFLNMEKTKKNHIETSSRASSIANFNTIDIDLRSNLGSASNHRFDDKILNNQPFVNVKSINENKKVNKKTTKNLLNKPSQN